MDQLGRLIAVLATIDVCSLACPVFVLWCESRPGWFGAPGSREPGVHFPRVSYAAVYFGHVRYYLRCFESNNPCIHKYMKFDV